MPTNPLLARTRAYTDMLRACYQWDHQDQVISVREHFAALGIPTWMDIDGGMQVDIFDSMAQGVANAAVVVAFISQRYQDSENCKLVRWVTVCFSIGPLWLRVNMHIAGAEVCQDEAGAHHPCHDAGWWLDSVRV